MTRKWEWAQHESLLYFTARGNVDRGRYRQAAFGCMRFEQITDSEAKAAYVKGTVLAVALRHLHQHELADATFNQAYGLAIKRRQLAIAAYILNDWASEASTEEAINRVRQAIELLENADGTPVPNREVPYDLAFFKVILARYLWRNNDREVAAGLLAEGKAILAEGCRANPYYETAYLLTLQYEILEFRAGASAYETRLRLQHLIQELKRQGKGLDSLVRPLSNKLAMYFRGQH